MADTVMSTMINGVAVGPDGMPLDPGIFGSGPGQIPSFIPSVADMASQQYLGQLKQLQAMDPDRQGASIGSLSTQAGFDYDREIGKYQAWEDLSPETYQTDFQKYNTQDQFGNWTPKVEDPVQVAKEAGFTSLGPLGRGLFPSGGGSTPIGYNVPTSEGGFFTIEDLFRRAGIPVPRIGTFGMDAPSTNNWRALGAPPGYIMRNGFLINPADARFGGPMGYSPSYVTAEHGSGPAPGISIGTGAAHGMPSLYSPGPLWGWPGADVSDWFNFYGGRTT